MPSANRNPTPTTSPGHQTGNGSGDSSYHFLRYSHIFASTVREVLEEKLLRKVSTDSLTLSQFHVVKLMALDGHRQVGEVAEFLGVSAPAASKNIDKLERLGLVVRSPSKGDRRATLLSVSRKGRRLVRRYEELRVARLSPALQTFEPEEIEQLTRLLERFSVSLLQVEPTEDTFCLRCGCYIEEGCSVGRIRGGCPYYKVLPLRRSESSKKEVS
ncbi:MAG TPA: MarR family winged helix-turn-helix transcriptional regulator [Phycisphaerae bacterium]|nr:MarR family winged helix-turn-helix transcriptional regulator [Phycisphaerae bacterium]